MTVINISSCDRCKPEKWKKGKEAAGYYWCIKCKRHIRYVLKKRKETGK